MVAIWSLFHETMVIIFLQNSLIDYFTGTREETFFFAIKSRIHMSALATREK